MFRNVLGLAALGVLGCVTFGSGPSMAAVILDFDETTIASLGGDDYSIDAVLRLSDEDLTSPPRLSSVNFGATFSPGDPGLQFVGISAPDSGAVFTTNATYSSGSPDPNAELYGSVISNTAANDPYAFDGGSVFTLNFSAMAGVMGTQTLSFIIDPSVTFYTVTGCGGTPVPFDGFSSADVTAVPEPGSAGLVLGAIFGAAYWKKRRSATASHRCAS